MDIKHMSLPQLTKVISDIDHWLCPMYREKLELDYDSDSISALTEKREAAGYGTTADKDAPSR